MKTILEFKNEEDAKKHIEAAHPMHTGRHEIYEEAMSLVCPRETKRELVELVNFLLYALSSAIETIDIYES